jgi:hypothetical protein
MATVSGNNRSATIFRIVIHSNSGRSLISWRIESKRIEKRKKRNGKKASNNNRLNNLLVITYRVNAYLTDGSNMTSLDTFTIQRQTSERDVFVVGLHMEYVITGPRTNRCLPIHHPTTGDVILRERERERER